jgi:Mor family transcriptional regulator
MTDERHSSNAQRVPELMVALADVAQRVILARCPESLDPDIGSEIARAFCIEFGGELVYIPKGHHLAKHARDQALYEYFVRSGRNAQATGKQFDLCVQQVYRRINMIEEGEAARIQPSLFGGESTEG